MNTRQAEYESAIDRLRADIAIWKAEIKAEMADWKAEMADWKAEMKAEMANWKTDMTRRENRLMLAMFGAVGLGTAILGALISIN